MKRVLSKAVEYQEQITLIVCHTLIICIIEHSNYILNNESDDNH